MEQKNHGSPSFINIAVLLLFAVVIAIASTATTYYFLSSKTTEQQTIIQPPIVPSVQTNVQPTIPTTTQTTAPADETANWKVYRNEKYGFEMKHPLNYIFSTKRGGYYPLLFSTSPQALVEFRIDENPQKLSLTQWVNRYGVIPDATPIKWNSIRISNQEFLKSSILGNMDNGYGFEALTKSDDKIYTIFFSTEEPNTENELHTFDQMLTTFKLLK